MCVLVCVSWSVSLCVSLCVLEYILVSVLVCVLEYVLVCVSWCVFPGVCPGMYVCAYTSDGGTSDWSCVLPLDYINFIKYSCNMLSLSPLLSLLSTLATCSLY